MPGAPFADALVFKGGTLLSKVARYNQSRETSTIVKRYGITQE